MSSLHGREVALTTPGSWPGQLPPAGLAGVQRSPGLCSWCVDVSRGPTAVPLLVPRCQPSEEEEGSSAQGKVYPGSPPQPPDPCPHPTAGQSPTFPHRGSGRRVANQPGGPERRGRRRRKPRRFLPPRREPSGQVALAAAPCAGLQRWEEKLSSFPRSPTHFNELSGGTPPRRLPRIRPPGSPAPFKEASGGGWTLAAVSKPRPLPAGGGCAVPGPGRARPCGSAAGSRGRSFSARPRALLSGEMRSLEEGKFVLRLSASPFAQGFAGPGPAPAAGRRLQRRRSPRLSPPRLPLSSAGSGGLLVLRGRVGDRGLPHPPPAAPQPLAGRRPARVVRGGGRAATADPAALRLQSWGSNRS